MSEEHAIVADERTIFGFWVYVMTDCMLFGTLFVTYGVLHNGTWGGPAARDVFSMPWVLVQTLLLLTSSFTCGLTRAEPSRAKVIGWLVVTGLLGAGFLGMELTEFARFIQEGNGWWHSAFFSAFFTLVGTHGLHVTFGLIWAIFLCLQVWRYGVDRSRARRLACFGLFWHFLDVVWIGIYTVVYLGGMA